MTTLSAKENYLRLTTGETPEYVPSTRPYRDRIATAMSGPLSLFRNPAMSGPNPPREYVDAWGITHIANAETGWQALPKPGVFLLEDVTKWEGIIKTPAIPENLDWEKYAIEDMAKIDRTQTAVVAQFSPQAPFQQVMAFMGFTEGLVAIIEEPEAVKELVNYMVDYFVFLAEKTLDYYKPDVLSIADDTASEYQPFISLAVFRDMFLPAYKRMTEEGVKRGIPIRFHNCGRCEDFVPDYVDIGVKLWNPAQPINNLDAIKAKYGNRIAICGGWENIPPSQPITEEEIREKVRSTINRYAVNGGFSFEGGVLASEYYKEEAARINDWIADEVYTYGSTFYN